MIGVVLITHNAKRHLPHCLPPLQNSACKPRILVVNSSSEDGTVELAQEMGAETLVIPRSEFNHGLTRERARRYLNTEIVVMMTPDAYAEKGMLEILTEPLLSKKASIAYARQLPHKGATFLEAFARSFNYPEESQLRSWEERGRYGVYTLFSSNSCAAYRKEALDAIGGFRHVLLGEDTLATSELLRLGHKIAYVAEARVCHSHSYTLFQEFQRHFDTGLARKTYSFAFEGVESDQRRGWLYLKTLFSTLAREKPALIPYATLQTGMKYVGYQLGRASVKAPTAFKRFFSSQDFYWQG